MPTKNFNFSVNGTEIKNQHEKLIAADILNLAAKAEAIPNKPENYFLESADEKNHRFKNDDWVNLHEYTEFITVPNSKTDVAATEL